MYKITNTLNAASITNAKFPGPRSTTDAKNEFYFAQPGNFYWSFIWFKEKQLYIF